MNATNVLLVSTDAAMIETVRGVLDGVTHVVLSPLSGVDDALDWLSQRDAGLVVVHQGAHDDAEDATRLVREIAACGRSVATLVVSDVHHAEQALSLLR